MCNGEDYFTCVLPYHLSVHHGLLSEQRVRAMKGDENLSEIDFQMEFEGKWVRISDNALLTSSDILPRRIMKNAWNPPTNIEYLEQKDKNKKNYYLQRLSSDEIRVLGVDVALMKSTTHANDNTVITLISAIPKNGEYMKQVPYIETCEGAKASEIALRIKQLYYDGQCDYISLDTMGRLMPLLYGNV